MPVFRERWMFHWIDGIGMILGGSIEVFFRDFMHKFSQKRAQIIAQIVREH